MDAKPHDAQHIELQPHEIWAEPEIQAQSSSKGVDLNRLPAYWVDPYRQDHSNGCAQAVMASMLVFWGKLQATPDLAYKFAQSSASNPNLLGGLLGTNWERVRDVFEAYGLRTKGFNNPDNKKYDPQFLINALASYTSKGIPVALILGNGELEPGQFGAHWWILCHIDQHEVKLVNDGNTVWTYPTTQFLDAWRADGLPWTHHAGVVVY